MSQQRIDMFVATMNAINHENARQKLQTIYVDNVKFIDPVKTIDGLEKLTTYFEALYERVNQCRFETTASIVTPENCSLEWVMYLQHEKISKGREILIEGASFIQFDGEKIVHHRDYYDLGALVYEHVPLLGSVVKKIRHAI